MNFSGYFAFLKGVYHALPYAIHLLLLFVFCVLAFFSLINLINR